MKSVPDAMLPGIRFDGEFVIVTISLKIVDNISQLVGVLGTSSFLAL